MVQAGLHCRNSYVTLEELPETVRRQVSRPLVADIIPLKAALATCEKELIEWALDQTEGNRIQAAELLEINRTTLSNKLRKYGIGTAGPGNGDAETAEDGKEARETGEV
jgi:DNA-binding NtrC family response regulator